MYAHHIDIIMHDLCQGAVGAAIYRASVDVDGDGEIDRQELAQYLDVVATQEQNRVIGRGSRVSGRGSRVKTRAVRG